MKKEERQLIEALFRAVGQNLQQHRILSGRSLLEIELATHIAAPLIAQYESGEKEIPVVDLVKLSQFLDAPFSAIFAYIPALVVAGEGSYSGFSEAHTEEFQQNFLKVSGPGRGDKFKKFIKKIAEDDGE